jgi:CubicO group peptidase (beta-lactamase class C family)
MNTFRLTMLWLLLCLPMVTAPAQTGALPNDLDAYAARILREFAVPGLAVAVVKDGQVVWSKGYGVRKLGEAAPVDEHTLFGIASNSKAFTAAALAMMVDEGKLRWDDRVIEHLPQFQMYDPYVTRELTVRDLLTHRSGLGLGAGDLMFWPGTDFKRAEIIQRIRFLKPASSFRSRYAYDNLLYMVAGEVLRAVSGQEWDAFVKQRIFAPLGMTRSKTSPAEFRPGDNLATPHARGDGTLKAIEYMNMDNVAAAGAINSCVSDMTKWLIAQLNGGEFRDQAGNAKRLFSQRQSQEMWSAQTILPINPNPPASLAVLKPNFSAYGLGWGLQDYRGRKIVSHTGGLAGLVSKVTLVPELKLGLVVLTNQEAGGAFNALSWHIVDGFLGAPPKDWIAAYRALAELQAQEEAKVLQGLGSTRAPDSRPALALAKYTGTYHDDWYGEVTIAQEAGQLVLRFSRTPLLTGTLEHWQFDTFVVHWRERTLNADAFVYFALKPDGSIEQMKMEAVSPLTDFSFNFQDLLFVPVKSAPLR